MPDINLVRATEGHAKRSHKSMYKEIILRVVEAFSPDKPEDLFCAAIRHCRFSDIDHDKR